MAIKKTKPMRYNITITRTYETEVFVNADSLQDAELWIENNEETINEEELEQCNIVETNAKIIEMEPSANERAEILCLMNTIKKLISDYRHVSEYIPQHLFDELDNLYYKYYNL